jgi:hypothetical protein
VIVASKDKDTEEDTDVKNPLYKRASSCPSETTILGDLACQGKTEHGARLESNGAAVKQAVWVSHAACVTGHVGQSPRAPGVPLLRKNVRGPHTCIKNKHFVSQKVRGKKCVLVVQYRIAQFSTHPDDI